MLNKTERLSTGGDLDERKSMSSDRRADSRRSSSGVSWSVQACQLSSSHDSGAPQRARGPVGTAPSCLFCVLTPQSPNTTQTSRRLEQPLDLPSEKAEECKERWRAKAECLKVDLLPLVGRERKKDIFVFRDGKQLKSIKSSTSECSLKVLECFRTENIALSLTAVATYSEVQVQVSGLFLGLQPVIIFISDSLHNNT